MFKNWKIAHKIMLMPALAAVALLVIVLLIPQAVTKNEELMDGIEGGYFPASELTRDLVATLASRRLQLEQLNETLGYLEQTLQASIDRFRGGDLNAFMGGVELDLRQAAIAEPPAVIDVFAMWGGIEIRVPERWSVDPRVTAILGGFEDKTRSPDDSTERLVVRGLVLMGGIEIKN